MKLNKLTFKLTLVKHLLRPWLIFAFSIFVVFLLYATKEQKKPQLQQETTWPVSVSRLTKESYQPNAVVYGRIEPLYSTTLRAGTIGYIQTLTANEGLEFKKDEVLAIIDPIDAKLRVDEKTQAVKRLNALIEAEKIKFEFDKVILEQQQKLIDISKKGVDRQQNLAKRSVASQANIETAQLELFREFISLQNRKLAIENYPEKIKQLEADLQSAQTALKQAELDLSRTQIIAPFDGRISKREISIGDRVQVNQELITIYDVNNLEIRAQFPTDQIALLQNALKQENQLTAKILDISESLTVVLDRLSGDIGLNEAGIEVIFSIKQSNPPLRVGQILKLLVNYPKEPDLFAVPFSSLFDVSSGYIVFKVIESETGTRLKSVPVQIKGDYFLETGAKYILIASETLESQDTILTTHLPNARDGLKVEIREEK